MPRLTLPAWLLGFVVLAGLSACGPHDPFEFTQPDTVKLIIGERQHNPIRQADSAVVYASSNPEVATVGTRGEVLALAPGFATISATRVLGDEVLKTAEYRIEVIRRDITLSAWVGEHDSELWLSEGLDGAELLASSDPNCDFNAITPCADARRQLARISAPRDDQLNQSQPVFYQLQHGEHRKRMAMNAARFAGRAALQTVYFKEQFWMMGSGTPRLLRDVWSSPDGVSWVLRREQAEFPTGNSNQLLLFKNQLWVVSTDKKEVWSSSDGVQWQPITKTAEYPGRTSSQVVVFDDGSGAGEQLWLIGGSGRNDVWTSSDGISWTPKPTNPDAVFSTRDGHQVVVYQNKLWVIGGSEGEHYLNDVWSSSNGIDWAEETADADFPARKFHQAVAFDDGQGEQLWLIGGVGNGGAKNDIWTSPNGITWTQRRIEADFQPRQTHQLVVAKQSLWLIGGIASPGGFVNDVWSSTNGLDWQQHTSVVPYSSRGGYQVVRFNDRFWFIGGGGPSADYNDVWSSPDGLSWTEHPSPARFSAREDHQVVAFQGRLWLIGGDSDGERKNDVWSSDNGIDWTLETANAGFTPRSGHQVVLFENQLWLIGGRDDSNNYRNDVWSSSDGRHWEAERSEAEFSARADHQVVAFRGQLWLIGGDDVRSNPTYVNDVWSSDDGRQWKRRTASAEFTARVNHQVTVFNDGQGERLWLSSGEQVGGARENDIWSSPDGVHWHLAKPPTYVNKSTGRFNLPVDGHQALAYDNQLWMINSESVWKSTNGVDWRVGLQVKTAFD